MIKAKINIVTMQEQDIPICPYCGTIPIVEVIVKKSPMESDSVSLQEVSCPCCGLCASRQVWEDICQAIDAPISKN